MSLWRVCDKCGEKSQDNINGKVKKYYLEKSLLEPEGAITFDLCPGCYNKLVSYIFEKEREEVTNNESGES